MSNPNLQTRESTQALTSGRAKLWVLLVGVNQYQDSHFPALHYSAADCQGLEEALLKAAYEFPQKHILTRHDFAVCASTLEVVQADLAQIVTEAKPQDTVLFYFSGHGMLEPKSQQAVLCLKDTSYDMLLETGLRIHELMHSLSVCEARQQIVWLDACHSGELILQGAKGSVKAALPLSEPTPQIIDALRLRAAQSRGFYALLSCDQGQRSWEFPELGHGLFTYHLIRGLQGEAADSEGVIGVDSLYRYIYYQTIEFINQKNRQLRRLNDQKRQSGDPLLLPEYPPQTPKRIVDGVGELVLGLKPEKVMEHFFQSTVPSCLPVELEQAAEQQKADPPAIGSLSAIGSLLTRGYRLILIGGVFTLILGAATLWFTQQSRHNGAMPVTDAEACNIQVKPEGQPAANAASNTRFDAQIVLSPCEANSRWRQVKAKSWLAGKPVWESIFAPDGKTLLTAGDRISEIWNLEDVQPIQTLRGHTDWVYTIAISPDGQTLASGSADRSIKLWDVKTGTLLRTLTGHQAPIWSIAISPDGQTLASGSADRSIKLWNLKTGELQQTLQGHSDWVFAVTFSPTQPVIASGSQDRTIKLWQAQTGELLQTLTGHQDTVRALAFAADGQRLASASWDKTVKLWQTQTGELLQTFTGHSDRVLTVAFNPADQTVVSGSRDHTIKLWDAASPAPIGTFYGHDDWILSVAFDKSGKTLVSSSRNQTVMLWQRQ